MKYSEYLRTHLTPEWSSQYISYEDMKEMLYNVVNKAPSTNQTSQSLSRQEYFLLADEEFLQYCEKEATKINTFFAEKLAEALLRLDVLKNELECLQNAGKYRHLSFSNRLHTSKNERSISENLNTKTNSNEEGNSNSWINNFKLKRSNTISQPRRIKRHRYRKLNDLKLAFSEFYLMIILLENYQTLNYTGFCKILKKHDQLFETTRGNEWRILYVDCTPFYTSHRVDQLINEVEKIYTDSLESGNRIKAMQRLRVPPLDEKQPQIVTFRLGMFSGMLCVLTPILIIVGYSLYGPHSSKSINWPAALHLYRSSFFIIIHIIFFGINIYGWSKAGVNHVLIFEMDPRNHLTYQKVLEVGTFLMVIWCLSLNTFLLSFYFDAYPFIQPLGFVIFLILFLINPMPIFYRQSRFWFIKKLFRVFSSPFHHVEFCDFWLGDQLCSLELVFFDLEFFLCFYINGYNISSSDSNHTFFCNGWSQVLLQSFFQSLPSWFRFVQCLRRYRDTKHKFPHLVNAGKYASGFFVIITNALRRTKDFDYHHNKLENPFVYLWIMTSLFSSTYKVIWDIKMDWGFFDKNAGENKYLREQIVYPRKCYYYIAIVTNIIFRYIWMINIFLHFNSVFAEYADIIGFSFAFIEIVRRFIWNYFRLENEHLNNCGEFRAVRDISIRPTLLGNDNSSFSHDTNSQYSTETNRNESRTATRTNTTIIEIPMARIYDSRRETARSMIRKKTNAEEFIDEMSIVLTLEPNSQLSLNDSENSIV